MTYDDVRQAINAQLPAASLNGADRIAAAFVKPGSDPTQGGAV